MDHLKLHVRGFSAMERRLLDGTVMLSQRRAPHIQLVDDAGASQADVVMIDALDPASMHWAAMQPWLAGKAAIWAGAKSVRAQHIAVDRHIKWPILPVLLYRAIEQAQGAPVASGVAPARDEPAGANRRVLIVDDSVPARMSLRLLLERMDIEVAEAATADVGIEAAVGGHYACVFMDVLMPGIDGFEACRRIKAKRAATPVIMLTSKSSPFDRVRGKIAGCDTYLTKPVDASQLREVVGRHVGLASVPDESIRTRPMPLYGALASGFHANP